MNTLIDFIIILYYAIFNVYFQFIDTNAMQNEHNEYFFKVYLLKNILHN